MPLLAFRFPEFDPVLVSFGPFAVRWYALAYVAGILIGWWFARRIAADGAAWGALSPLRPSEVDDAIVWVAIGVVLGGRLGYVLFYQPAYFAAHPAEILILWRGGMSFHGGFLGAVLGMILFARRRGIPVLALLDLAAIVTPIGLFLGRVANFVNGELWGRVSDVPWAVIFPHAGPEPRHPSQLYQAGLEGVVLFLVLLFALRRGALARPGMTGGLFVAGYGVVRVIGEVFREPDAHIGFLAGGLTMGMLLSIPMILAGCIAVLYALRRSPA